MMRNPVHIHDSAPPVRQVTTKMNCQVLKIHVSENTSPTVENALMLKSPPMKSTLCCSHVAMQPSVEEQWKHHISWPLTLWMCTEQNVTVGVPESEGRRNRPRTMSRTIPHVPLLVESSLKARIYRVGLEGVLVEQDSKVRVASVCNELIGGVRNMIIGFLKSNRMELFHRLRKQCWSDFCAPGLNSIEEGKDGIDDA